MRDDRAGATLDLEAALDTQEDVTALTLDPEQVSRRLATPGGFALLRRFRRLESLVLEGPRFSRAALPGEPVALPPELGALRSLRKLELPRCEVNDVAVLAELPALESLRLAYTPFSSLESLAGLRRLRELDLTSCRGVVRDLSPLAALPLERLVLDGTAAESVAPLRTIATLRELDLSACDDVSDFALLLAHPGLERLTGDDGVAQVWARRGEIAAVPPPAELRAALAGDLDSVRAALRALALLVELSDYGRPTPNPLRAIFATPRSPDRARPLFGADWLALEPLDGALRRLRAGLPPDSLADAVCATFSRSTDDFVAARLAFEELAWRGDLPSQLRAVRAFLRARAHDDSGHRLHDDTVLDRLIDDWLPAFHPAALVELLCSLSDVDLCEDELDHLFEVAAAGELSAADRARLEERARRY